MRLLDLMENINLLEPAGTYQISVYGNPYISWTGSYFKEVFNLLKTFDWLGGSDRKLELYKNCTFERII